MVQLSIKISLNNHQTKIKAIAVTVIDILLLHESLEK